MNLYQFFYAFGLGLVFGYVYLRTGRLRCSVFLHIIINTLGSVVAPLLLSRISIDDIGRMTSMNMSDAEIMQLLPHSSVIFYLFDKLI